MPLSSGTHLGPYEILAPLGAGGMGEVYRAKDARLDREVAIKVLPESTAKDPEALARFEREAKAVAALSHPNILALHDVGKENDVVYAVMELLEGETLRGKLQHGPLAPRKALDYAGQIALGLAAAHDKGIVHRDLKPENIFITKDGRLKILDLGLARQLPPLNVEAAGQGTPTRSLATAEGTVLGTVGYMAPEQVKGKPADHRADIFAFGAVLYEMLCGARAFKGDSAVDTMHAILHGEPQEFDSSARGIAPGVMALVHHCLEKEPDARFQSARDLAFGLESLSGDSGHRVTSSGMASGKMKLPLTRRVGFRQAAAALILFAVGIIAGSRFGVRRAEPLILKRLTFQKGYVNAARFAPGGKATIYSARWKESAESRLFSAEPGNPEAIAISPLDAVLLAVSAKGEMAVRLRSKPLFGWVERGVLARMPAGGGTPRELLENVGDADWSPDGEKLAVTVYENGKCRLEYPVGKTLFETAGWVSAPAISPDGNGIAFLDHTIPGDDRGAIALIGSDGKKRMLSQVFDSVQGLRWDAAGRRLWTSASEKGNNRSLLMVELGGEVRLVWAGTEQTILFDRSSDGRLLIGSGVHTYRVTGKLAGDEKESDYTWLDWTRPVAISPDGKSYLVTEQGFGGGPGYSVYLGQAGGAAPVRLGTGNGLGFSQDGKWALALSLESGPSRIRFLPVGPGEPREITVEGIHLQNGGFHHTGKALLMLGAADGQSFRIWRIALGGGKPAPVTDEFVFGSAVSPDEKWLLARDKNKDEWRLISLDGGPPQSVQLPAPPSKTSFAAYTPDGRGYFFMGNDPASRTTLFKVDAATGKSVVWRKFDLTAMNGGRPGNLYLSPDGNSYLNSYVERQTNLYFADGR